MSWFKHRPPKHPPPIKHHVQHHRNSPASQRMKEEAKATAPTPTSTHKKNQASHN